MVRTWPTVVQPLQPLIPPALLRNKATACASQPAPALCLHSAPVPPTPTVHSAHELLLLRPRCRCAQVLRSGQESDNVIVGGRNRWTYDSFVNWEMWWPGFPILVYFKVG